MNLSHFMTVFGAVGALLCLLGIGYLTIQRYPNLLRERLDRTLGRDEERDVARPAASTEVRSNVRMWAMLGAIIPTREKELQTYRLRLHRAGFASPHAVTMFFLARLAGLFVPILLYLCARYCGAAGRWTAVSGLAAAIFGFLLPGFLLNWKIERRLLTLRRGLPDFLDLMVVCLESGLSLPSALQQVAQEIHIAQPLLEGELALVQRDMALGAPIDRAFKSFAHRTGLEVINTLSTFIRESRRFGSELVDAFRSQAETLRHEREQRAEEHAQKASVKILFPMLFLILPAIFVVLAGPAAIQIQAAFSK